MKALIGIAVALFTLSSHSTTLTSEEIFSKAEGYTLKILTSVSTPFIDDEEGTYKGTGFLIDKERGWILTNAHVASRSPSTIVGMFKGNDYISLNKIYIDPVVDIAILKINPDKIPNLATEADLDCDNSYRTGHPVGAYGHPWEVSFTATRGILSGVTYLGDDEWLQVDAPINHGNSGGPLISLETGKVIGVNTATASESNTQGLNFATKIKPACIITGLLKEDINPSPIDLGLIFYMSDTNSNFKVSYVDNYLNKDIHVGDIIKSVNGIEALNTTNHLFNSLRGKENYVNTLIERNKKTIEVKLNLEKYPLIIGSKGISFSGIILTKHNFIDRQKDNKKSEWLVNHISGDSPAASFQIDYWSFIEKFNDISFNDINNLYNYINSLEENDTLALDVKSLSDSKYRMYDYRQVDISVSNLEIITISK